MKNLFKLCSTKKRTFFVMTIDVDDGKRTDELIDPSAGQIRLCETVAYIQGLKSAESRRISDPAAMLQDPPPKNSDPPL